MEWFMTARAEFWPCRNPNPRCKPLFRGRNWISCTLALQKPFQSMNVSSAVTYSPRANFRDFKRRLSKRIPNFAFIDRSNYIIVVKYGGTIVYFFPQLFLTVKPIANCTNDNVTYETVKWFNPDDISCWIIKNK